MSCHFLVLPVTVTFLEDGNTWAIILAMHYPRGQIGHLPKGPLRWDDCASSQGRGQSRGTNAEREATKEWEREDPAACPRGSQP